MPSCTDMSPCSQVECSANRRDIDTGAGIARLNGLTRVEVNALELHTWTIDVDESC